MTEEPYSTRTDDGGILTFGAWHRTFAWLPVWGLDTGWMWLRTVERQISQKTRPTGVTTYVTTYRPLPGAGLGLAKDGD